MQIEVHECTYMYACKVVYAHIVRIQMCFVHVHVQLCAYLCITFIVAYASAFDVCTAIISRDTLYPTNTPGCY